MMAVPPVFDGYMKKWRGKMGSHPANSWGKRNRAKERGAEHELGEGRGGRGELDEFAC
jgi:hypothetical protein